MQVESSDDEDQRPAGAMYGEIKTKVSKKDIDAIDKSIGKGGVNIDHEKDKYLGGDDDVIEGFYGSDEEIDFSKLKKK